MDTQEDIKRRKQLANNALRKLSHVFEDKHLKVKTKVRVFRACVESVFSYNSELWTTNKTTSNKIDSFHRRLLRRAINIRWPKEISSEDLYQTTKQQKWSETIKTRRLRWYGHAERLHEKTPAKQALAEARRQTKKLRGGQASTWLKTLDKDLKDLKITPEEAQELTQNRKEWRKLINRKPDAPRANALRA